MDRKQINKALFSSTAAFLIASDYREKMDEPEIQTFKNFMESEPIADLYQTIKQHPRCVKR